MSVISELFHGGIMGLNYTIERPNAPHNDEYVTAYVSVELDDPNSLLVNCDLNAIPNPIVVSHLKKTLYAKPRITWGTN